MPYAEDFSGIYVIKNEVTGKGYVGQSRTMRKRVADHFNLLRRGRHPNTHLQRAFKKYGEAAFSYDFEIVCEDVSELNMLEEAYLTGDAKFDDSPVYYNISKTARVPMFGRSHTEETRKKISLAKKGQTGHVTDSYREKLSRSRKERALSDPEYRNKVLYIVSNPNLSYAERGRHVGIDTSTTRKLALKYANNKELLHG